MEQPQMGRRSGSDTRRRNTDRPSRWRVEAARRIAFKALLAYECDMRLIAWTLKCSVSTLYGKYPDLIESKRHRRKGDPFVELMRSDEFNKKTQQWCSRAIALIALERSGFPTSVTAKALDVSTKTVYRLRASVVAFAKSHRVYWLYMSMKSTPYRPTRNDFDPTERRQMRTDWGAEK